jgi:hypothetical protein
MSKPNLLYHASANRNLTILEPRKESFRDPNEGPVIFATPYIDYASCFIVKTDDSWVRISRFGQKQPWNIIISDINKFKNADQGGAIYELPAKSFYCDINKGMRESEWVTTENITPISKKTYDSGLKAMIENGVKVYFVPKKVFAEIIKSEDHGYAIIQLLMPYSL